MAEEFENVPKVFIFNIFTFKHLEKTSYKYVSNFVQSLSLLALKCSFFKRQFGISTCFATYRKVPLPYFK